MKRTKDNILWIFLHLHKTGGTTFVSHLDKNFGKKFFPLYSREKQEEFNKKTIKEKQKIKVLAGHEIHYGIHKKIPDKEERYIIFIRNPAERLVSKYNHQMTKKKNSDLISFNDWYEKYPVNEIVYFLNKRFKATGKKIQRSTISLKFLKHLDKIFFWERLSWRLKSFQNKITSDEKRLENAKKLLKKCWFVAVTENLDKDLKFICKEMGISQNWKNMRVAGKEETWKSDYLGESLKPAPKKFTLDEKTKKRIYKDNPLDMKLYLYAKKLNKQKRRDLMNSLS